MKINNTKVYNFEGAFRGMRNPMNSWDKSDSIFGLARIEDADDNLIIVATDWANSEFPEDILDSEKEEIRQSRKFDDRIDYYINWLYDNQLRTDGDTVDMIAIGPNDMSLAQRLIRGGSEHRKFMRQIFVSFDITAPIFFYKELDTYKIGTTANSTSIMHKLASTPITLECFETDDYEPVEFIGGEIEFIIKYLETLRQYYNKTKNKKYWKELVRWLPESWLQTRTITVSYENLYNIIRQRQNHKLSEWHYFCNWVKTLPYANELLFLDIKET